MSSIKEYAENGGFPTFVPLFEKAFSESGQVPPYLDLLGLAYTSEALTAIRLVRHAIAASPNTSQEIVALFMEYNWRTHLIGAVGILVGTADTRTINALWEAFDSGSWISPQLAATAYLSDPEFEARARQRIEAGCPISRERLAGLAWVKRHSVAGPGSFADHSAKALTALAALCRTLASAKEEGSWLELATTQETIQSILASDRDCGGDIAIGWRQRIESLLGDNS